jgi:hypothetical protein
MRRFAAAAPPQHANSPQPDVQARDAVESIIYVWQAVLEAPAVAGAKAEALLTLSTARNCTM